MIWLSGEIEEALRKLHKRIFDIDNDLPSSLKMLTDPFDSNAEGKPLIYANRHNNTYIPAFHHLLLIFLIIFDDFYLQSSLSNKNQQWFSKRKK